jgi:nicotinamidase-related amidase
VAKCRAEPARRASPAGDGRIGRRRSCRRTRARGSRSPQAVHPAPSRPDRIACLKKDGRDRSLSQKKPGFNYLLLPKDSPESRIVPELAPQDDEIVVLETTDSALTGTNLRLILHNMGIRKVVVAGIFTDQCVSSTVRSLADESFDVVVVEDCCAAATMELHRHELEVINMIYCHVVQLEDVFGFYAARHSSA